LDFETRAIFLHVRGEVEMGRVLSCNKHRLSDQQRRLDRLVASEVRQLGVEDHQHHQQEEDEDRDQALALVATAEER